MSYNKYYLYKKQVSYDRGTTWEDVTPLETVPSGNSIGTYDTLEECESGDTPSPIPYSGQYLTFTALGNGTFKFSGTSGNSSIQYSLDSGSTWVTLASGVASPTVSVGNEIWWKGNLIPVTSGGNYGIGKFSSTSSFNAKGNIMSLLYGDDFEGKTDLTGKNYAFHYLFSGCTGLNSAENLVLPATILVTFCYRYMFIGCTSLITTPELPATTMMYGCYYGMFQGCASLTTTPQLPATTLADSCYESMFQDCTSLTTAPELPATTLADECYNLMFQGCASLTTAPVLSATTLVYWCYYGMFYNCSSLNYIKCLATDISAINCTKNWLYNVSSYGTFVKASSMSSWPSGGSGIPTIWTVQNA